MEVKLLEINLVSANLLDKARYSDGIYAVVWIDPTQTFKTSLVQTETTTPWEERFVFVVEAKLLNSISTAHLVIELYSTGDILLGTSTLLLGAFGNCGRHYSQTSTGTFRGFYVREENGNPIGTVEVGITVLQGLEIHFSPPHIPETHPAHSTGFTFAEKTALLWEFCLLRLRAWRASRNTLLRSGEKESVSRCRELLGRLLRR